MEENDFIKTKICDLETKPKIVKTQTRKYVAAVVLLILLFPGIDKIAFFLPKFLWWAIKIAIGMIFIGIIM